LTAKIGLAVTSPFLFEIAKESLLANRGLVAVVFAAASLEALINEVSELADLEVQAATQDDQRDNDEVLRAFAEAMSEAERSRGSIQLKFIVASLILKGRPYRKGLQPFQDFSLLMNLRNSIMHLRPTTLTRLGENATQVTFDGCVLKELSARGLIKRPKPNTVTSLLSEAGGRQVARWAVNTAADMAQSFLSLFPEPFKSDVLIDQAEVFRRIDAVGSHSSASKRPN
jgi:hypothetical protein